MSTFNWLDLGHVKVSNLYLYNLIDNYLIMLFMLLLNGFTFNINSDSNEIHVCMYER